MRRGSSVLQDERREHPQVGIEHKEGVVSRPTIRSAPSPGGLQRPGKARASGENLGSSPGYRCTAKSEIVLPAPSVRPQRSAQFVHTIGVRRGVLRVSRPLWRRKGRRAILAGQDKIRNSLTSAERSRRGMHGCPLHVACVVCYCRERKVRDFMVHIHVTPLSRSRLSASPRGMVIAVPYLSTNLCPSSATPTDRGCSPFPQGMFLLGVQPHMPFRKFTAMPWGKLDASTCLPSAGSPKRAHSS